MRRSWIFATAATVALSPASAATQAAATSPAAGCSALPNDNPALLPYLSFSTATPPVGLAMPSGLEGGQGYTRLRLTFQPCSYARPSSASAAQSGRLYPTEGRSWVERLFAPKAVSKILTVKTSFSNPSTSTVHTVATIGRDSSRRVGEVWNTEVTNSRWLTPYFSVDGDSVVNVDISLAASTD